MYMRAVVYTCIGIYGIEGKSAYVHAWLRNIKVYIYIKYQNVHIYMYVVKLKVNVYTCSAAARGKRVYYTHAMVLRVQYMQCVHGAKVMGPILVV